MIILCSSLIQTLFKSKKLKRQLLKQIVIITKTLEQDVYNANWLYILNTYYNIILMIISITFLIGNDIYFNDHSSHKSMVKSSSTINALITIFNIIKNIISQYCSIE